MSTRSWQSRSGLALGFAASVMGILLVSSGQARADDDVVAAGEERGLLV